MLIKFKFYKQKGGVSLPAEKVCNVCGRHLDFFDIQQELVIHKLLGYGSKFDGDVIRLRMCCDCFDDLVEACKVSPIDEEVK